jgi:hypothetical protein
MFLNTQTFQYPAVRPKCYEFNSYWRLSIVPFSQFLPKIEHPPGTEESHNFTQPHQNGTAAIQARRTLPFKQ